MTQTIIRIGNSQGIIIPKQYLTELNLKEGSEVIVEKKGSELKVMPKSKMLAPDINPKFMQMVDDFVSDHEDVLKILAKK